MTFVNPIEYLKYSEDQKHLKPSLVRANCRALDRHPDPAALRYSRTEHNEQAEHNFADIEMQWRNAQVREGSSHTQVTQQNERYKFRPHLPRTCFLSVDVWTYNL